MADMRALSSSTASCSGRGLPATGVQHCFATFRPQDRPGGRRKERCTVTAAHNSRHAEERDASTTACPACTPSASCTCGTRRRGTPGTEAQPGLRAPLAALSGVALAQALDALMPQASAAAEALPLDLLSAFLDTVESMGVYGPLVFVATMVGAEMVPLFPTQPLTIASGLLFGAPKGTALALVAATSAAVLAFQLSRRVGRRLAERWIAEELGGEEDRADGVFARVQTAIDSGSFWQQLVAVTLLRLTPVVPFSASNYLLGATPLKFSAYLVGSVAGISFWSAVFASLGGAGRELLESGLSLDVLYGDLLAQASGYTGSAAAVAGALGGAALLFYKFGPQASPDSK